MGEAALAALPGLGPKSAQMLVEAGVGDPAALEELGPAGAFRAVRFRHGRAATTNFIYAIDCAIRRLDWRMLEASRKSELKEMARAVIAELEGA
jgi:hypothetical protein